MSPSVVVIGEEKSLTWFDNGGVHVKRGFCVGAERTHSRELTNKEKTTTQKQETIKIPFRHERDRPLRPLTLHP